MIIHDRAFGHIERSFNWFQDIYKNLNPEEIADRCNLSFNNGAFSLRIMGRQYQAGFPEFSLKQPKIAHNSANPVNAGIESEGEKVLFLRFLCEGKYVEAAGKQLSYREIPWGDLYYPNFEGRCIKRLAAKFGGRIEAFSKTMETRFNAEKLSAGDAGYRFEFCSGLYMSFILWEGDDEFPASAQILFDDNFPQAFTAEDIAVAGDAAINHLA